MLAIDRCDDDDSMMLVINLDGSIYLAKILYKSHPSGYRSLSHSRKVEYKFSLVESTKQIICPDSLNSNGRQCYIIADGRLFSFEIGNVSNDIVPCAEIIHSLGYLIKVVSSKGYIYLLDDEGEMCQMNYHQGYLTSPVMNYSNVKDIVGGERSCLLITNDNHVLYRDHGMYYENNRWIPKQFTELPELSKKLAMSNVVSGYYDGYHGVTVLLIDGAIYFRGMWCSTINHESFRILRNRRHKYIDRNINGGIPYFIKLYITWNMVVAIDELGYYYLAGEIRPTQHDGMAIYFREILNDLVPQHVPNSIKLKRIGLWDESLMFPGDLPLKIQVKSARTAEPTAG